MSHYHVPALAKITGTEVEAPKKRGRPKGKPSLAVALTHELINKKAENVVKKVLAIALDDKHPKQMEALKMCFDRLAPVSVFEKAAEHQKNKGIEININVVQPGNGPAQTASDVIEVQAKEVTDGGS